MARRHDPLKVGPRMNRAAYTRIRENAFRLIAQGYSIISLGEMLGLSKPSAKHYIDIFRAKLRKAEKGLPSCRCGGPHNHFGHCLEKRHGCRTGLRPMPDDFEKVAPTLTRKDLIYHYHTSPPTRDRWLAEAPNVTPKVRTPRPLRSSARSRSNINDDLYIEIDRLVPAGIADDIRAEAISELYLAVLDGTIARDQLAAKGRAVLNRVTDFCGLHGQTVSLDLPIGEGGASYVDNVRDETALDAFDRLFDDDEWG